MSKEIGLSDNVELLKRIYDRFNPTRHGEGARGLARRCHLGKWHGRGPRPRARRSTQLLDAAIVDPHVEPVAFAEGPKAEVIVEHGRAYLSNQKRTGQEVDIREGIDAIPVLRVAPAGANSKEPNHFLFAD